MKVYLLLPSQTSLRLTSPTNYTYDYCMDQKNQNLTPELKQIYDRVMNTQVKQPPTPAAASTGPIPAPSNGGQITPPTPQPMAQPSPASTTQPSSLPTNQPSGTLPSVPPRPLTDDKKPFVFNGKVEGEQNDTQPGTHAAEGKKISGSVIVLGVAVLIIVWGLLWAKIFGLF